MKIWHLAMALAGIANASVMIPASKSPYLVNPILNFKDSAYQRAVKTQFFADDTASFRRNASKCVAPRCIADAQAKTIVSTSEVTIAFVDSAGGTSLHQKYDAPDGTYYIPAWYAFDAQGKFSKLIENSSFLRDTLIVNATQSIHYVVTNVTTDTTVFTWHGDACADEEEHVLDITITKINDVQKGDGEYDTTLKRIAWTLDADGHCTTGLRQNNIAGTWTTNSTTKIFWKGNVPTWAIELASTGDTLSKRLFSTDEANQRLTGYQDSVKGKSGWYRNSVTTAVYDTKGIQYMTGTNYDTIGRVVGQSISSHNRADLDKIGSTGILARPVTAPHHPAVQLRRGTLLVSNPGAPVTIQFKRLDGSTLREASVPAGTSTLPLDLLKSHGLCLWNIRNGDGVVAGTLLLP